MEREKQKQIVEALILAAPEPISAQRLADIVPRLKPAGVKELVAELGREYQEQGRAFEIWEVAGGYQLRTLPAYANWVKQLLKERAMRLSRAALETLSVVAYKQPVTRAEVEHVRGVEVGPVLRSLVDRKLVKIAGHRDVPGRPMVYATTKRFLEVFGLPRLDDLPTLREVEDLLPADPEESATPTGEASAGDAGAEGLTAATPEEGAPVTEVSSELH
jgi:segregation and condensation protein B